MREILIGAVAAIVVAVVAGIWLGQVQTPVADRYSVGTTVRL
jgi:hypothetical protein